MTLMLTRIGVDDYDSWKAMFDAGRDTVRSRAKGHRILRAVDDPNEVFVQVEFASPEDARAAHAELQASGALERVQVRVPPTVAEIAEKVDY